MKIGILSFAHVHADAYARILHALPDVEFIGIADGDAERGQQAAAQYETHLFPSYDALFAARPDGVIVCSENVHHRALTELAASAGAHVMSEKPLATTLEDARAMLNACETAGVSLMTAFPMRFNVPVIETKRLLDKGALGQVYAANTTNQGQSPRIHRGWFVEKALAGGGVLTDHVVHVADVLRWYLSSEVVEVYAQANDILYAGEGDVETGGQVMLTFDNGVFATIDCSWSRPLYYPVWGGVTMDIVGRNGLVSVNAFRQIMTVYTEARQRPAYAYWGSDSNHAMVSEFTAAIREQRLPSVTGYDGYKAVEIVTAAYESVRIGQPVKLSVG